jgi:addiction module RelE/StbE family toxin
VKVEWRPLAEADLSEIVRYVASENPIAAYDLHRKIVGHAAILAEHPLIGRPGRIDDTRELVVPRTHYIVAYRLAGETIIVLRVLHTARRWPLSV